MIVHCYMMLWYYYSVIAIGETVVIYVIVISDVLPFNNEVNDGRLIIQNKLGTGTSSEGN